MDKVETKVRAGEYTGTAQFVDSVVLPIAVDTLNGRRGGYHQAEDMFGTFAAGAAVMKLPDVTQYPIIYPTVDSNIPAERLCVMILLMSGECYMLSYPGSLYRRIMQPVVEFMHPQRVVYYPMAVFTRRCILPADLDYEEDDDAIIAAIQQYNHSCHEKIAWVMVRRDRLRSNRASYIRVI